jgi:hypothetical protein
MFPSSGEGVVFLEYQAMDKVQKPSNLKDYPPQSGPFRLYLLAHFPYFEKLKVGL